jgi:hypothetical protein
MSELPRCELRALQVAHNSEGSLLNLEPPFYNTEQSHTPMIVPPIVNLENREENSHTDARQREGGHPSNHEEVARELFIGRPILSILPRSSQRILPKSRPRKR